MDENRRGDRHPVVQEYRTASRSAIDAESARSFRSLPISDFDLGTRYRKAHALLEFFRSHYAEILYLIGDIVDGWNSGRWYWSPVQNAMAREIVDWGWRNARLLILPGSDDRRLRCKLDRRSLRTYLKRFLSKATNCLTAARFNEVRL